MKLIDNINQTLKDDLKIILKKNSKVSIAASFFSIYAYETLKEQFSGIEELRFIFTSPAFTTEKAKKEKREFYIPRLEREKSLYGTEFEIKLRNELTQKAIAKECADWVRQRVVFKSNITTENIPGFINVENNKDTFTYLPINGFTTVDLGCEKGNNAYNFVNRLDSDFSKEYFRIFDEVWNDKQKLQDVTDEIIENITIAYKENSADFIYFVILYNIFNEFLDDVSEDVLPNEATGFKDSQIWNKLYDFQRDAALSVINKLETYNGCILADSVGLGKTFTALSIIKYYENRNKSVMVLCPKKLSDNWNTFKLNLLNNPVAKDRLRYDVLYHTDLSRNSGYTNGIPLDRVNWSNYDLVVIDESHNFRNGGDINVDEKEKENRYERLMNQVIRKGVRTKVLMLSATPVNNKFSDLKNQLALAYEGNVDQIHQKLNTKQSIDDIFKNAQQAFNKWSNFVSEERTTDRLLEMLDYEFFKVLDSVTIARSRKHIEKYYNTEDIGKFPERNHPISINCPLTKLSGAIDYDEIYDKLTLLNLSIYTPSIFIHESKIQKYEEKYDTKLKNNSFKQRDRENSLRTLMRTNLLKRLESSVHAFRLTAGKILINICQTIILIEEFKSKGSIEFSTQNISEDFDLDDQNYDLFFTGGKVKIEFNDMDYKSWLNDLTSDKEILEQLLDQIAVIKPENDEKLITLSNIVRSKIQNPINPGNRKILIFSAFADTVEYLYDNISQIVKSEFGLDTAMITGSVNGKTTIPKLKVDFNLVLTFFSPISKERDLLQLKQKADIDILIATDCISEGQNLQDCDYLVNYDIHWNPVRIIQRFGRIDRIGSKNKQIQLVNFWPDISLDDYINLKSRVENRMRISVMTSTGDDNPINEEKGDLEYRKQQLERLHDEVVDIEDMSTGISIMDLGLNEFRIDLLSYIKENPDIKNTPFGMHTVVKNISSHEFPSGVIYVLKNINSDVNINNTNRLHPFYLVYISNNGEIFYNHLSPKKILDTIRYLCKDKNEPNLTLCGEFNKETKEGKKMDKYSALLESSISSIIDANDESDIDSLFKSGGTTALLTNISGLKDFELICFVVVK